MNLSLSVFIGYVLALTCVQVQAQIVLLPDEHVADPFKDNPKWTKFKLEQWERLDELKVLVDNVYNLLEVNFPTARNSSQILVVPLNTLGLTF